MENDHVNAEIQNIKSEIVDIKGNYKELNKEMTAMKESHIETKIYIKQIQESQSKMEKASTDNQERMLQGIQEIKDKPIRDYDKIKIAVWIFAVTYVMGNIFGLMKIFTP